jgi:hypothetical protein
MEELPVCDLKAVGMIVQRRKVLTTELSSIQAKTDLRTCPFPGAACIVARHTIHDVVIGPIFLSNIGSAQAVLGTTKR